MPALDGAVHTRCEREIPVPDESHHFGCERRSPDDRPSALSGGPPWAFLKSPTTTSRRKSSPAISPCCSTSGRPGAARAVRSPRSWRSWPARTTGAAKVAKLNVDDAPGAAQTYGVSSIPTIMVFKGGEVVDRFVGVQAKNRLQEAIDSAKG